MKHKTYAKKIRQSKRKELLAKIDEAITFHEKFRNAYFFKPPSCAAKRRYYEIYNQREIEFNYNGATYRYSGFTECSCNNVYYYGSFYMDGDRKTIRVFKKIKQDLVEAREAYEKNHSVNQSYKYIFKKANKNIKSYEVLVGKGNKYYEMQL